MHLVSLEGFADYLGPDPKPIPTRPGSSELMDVQLVSLYNWTFVSLPESFASFEASVATADRQRGRHAGQRCGSQPGRACRPPPSSRLATVTWR